MTKIIGKAICLLPFIEDYLRGKLALTGDKENELAYLTTVSVNRLPGILPVILNTLNLRPFQPRDVISL